MSDASWSISIAQAMSTASYIGTAAAEGSNWAQASTMQAGPDALTG